MLQLAQAVEDAAAIGDIELYLRIARDIHTALCEAARNEFLQGFMGSLYVLSRQFSFAYLREVDLPRAAGTHAGILRAVAARDPEAAALASQRMMEFLEPFTADRQDKPHRAKASRTEPSPRGARRA
jgi:DNA-binding GntR family transcriptional regulator